MVADHPRGQHQGGMSRTRPYSMNIVQQVENLPPYGNGTLPAGIRSRTVDNNNGLKVHVLEAGHFALDTKADEIAGIVGGFLSRGGKAYAGRV